MVTSLKAALRAPGFRGWMSVTGVVTALLTAGLALQQTRLLNEVSAGDDRAKRLGVLTIESQALMLDAAQMQLSRYQLWDGQQRRAGEARQRAEAGDRTAMDESRSWSAVAAATLEETDRLAEEQTRALHEIATLDQDLELQQQVCPLAPFGVRPRTGCHSWTSPSADSEFPRRYLAEARWPTYRLEALRADATSRSAALGRQLGALNLALFALSLAIFLSGFAVATAAQKRRILFAVASLALTICAFGYVVVVAILWRALPPGAGPDRLQAASHYADGMVAAEIRDRVSARRSFAQALDAWPDFALAAFERGRVAATLRDAIADYELAGARGLATPQLAMELAHAKTQLAIASGRDDDLDAAEHAARKAEALASTDATPVWDLGLIDLLRGDARSARDHYRVGRRVAVQQASGDREYVHSISGALSDLQRASGHRNVRSNDIHSIEALLAAGAASLRRRSVAPAGTLAIHVDPGWASWTLPVSRPVTVRRDRIVTLWYYRPSAAAVWNVVSELSGRVRSELAEPGVLSDDVAVLRATTRDSQTSCLRPGDYALAVFVNGRFMARAQTRLRGARLVPAVARELNLGLCVPEHWRRVNPGSDLPQSRLAFPGLAAAWSDPQGTEGALVLRFNGQFSLAEIEGRERSSRAASLAAAAAHEWRRLFPSTPEPRGTWSPGTFRLNFSRGHSVLREFVYDTTPEVAKHHAPDGRIRVQVAFNKNDVAFTLLTYGPTAGAPARASVEASVGAVLN